MSDRPYSRHYHDLVDDPKFTDIFPDDRHYACWSRLLMIADQAWPASAHLPATARRASVKKLAEVGLIDLLPDGRFRVHGLQHEREQRAANASHAATERWRNTPRNANGNAERIASAPGTRMPRRDETSIDETRQDADGRDDLEAFLSVSFRAPTERQRAFLDGYCRTFDQTGPARAARLIFAHPDDPIGALKTDLQAWRDQRRTEAQAAEAPKPEPHRRPAKGLTGINGELAAMFRAKDQEATA